MSFTPLYDEDSYYRGCKAHVVACNGNSLILDRTVFYPLGGGQLGDTGTMLVGGTRYRIRDTVWTEDNQVSHILDAPLLSEIQCSIVGRSVEVILDWERRYRIMRFHTALHVLHKVVPFRCTGAKVGPDKSHLDFDTVGQHLDVAVVDDLNSILREGHPVSTRSVLEDEVEKTPSLAQTIRLAPPVRNGFMRFVQIGSDDNIVDLQPCGGTHVRNTSEIGRIVVLKNKSRGIQNRRLTVGFCT
ncbi:alanyl-tRNA editing protein [Thalassospira lucentensis]|uniref:alanyl-tRNA editing protein n=1 Tax=Thalassospira lucentensis TaxID=168935 RepID=UPI00399D7430